MRLLTALIAFLSIQFLAFSATIYVPDDYPTIQGAIDASANGNTVIVRPGTYVENIDFVGKAITVQSEHGSSVTTIDGNQAGSVVNFSSGEGAGSVLDGFTIMNGYNSSAGGIRCLSSSPTITHNTVSDNHAGYGSGGGILCSSSSPTIFNNTISGNSANDWPGDGGGIYCYSSSPSISNNTISGNSADFDGGGICCKYSSSPTIENNTITGNSVGHSDGGGGICCKYSSSPTISNNTISGNAAIYGGGICCTAYSDTTIINNFITGNTANDLGGGILCGFYAGSTITTITNNTIMGNTANNLGGGILCSGSGDATIANTILWHNTAPEGPEIWIGISTYPFTLTISYSDVEGGQSSVHVESGCTLNWGAGMIDADPLFADPASEDFHITWDSPCLDSGDKSVVTALFDFEGDPRIALGVAVDMGADEYWFHTYHVGRVIPGSTIDLKFVGWPTAPVTLAMDDSIVDPPTPTPHGDLHLPWPPLWSGYIGKVPANGILTLPLTIPSGSTSGDVGYFQSLIGPWGGPYTRLSNLLTLTVE